MDMVRLVMGGVALLLGVAVLVTGWVPPAWRPNPAWVFAGVMFGFSVVFLASWAGSRVAAPLGLLQFVGFAAAIGFAMFGMNNRKKTRGRA